MVSMIQYEKGPDTFSRKDRYNLLVNRSVLIEGSKPWQILRMNLYSTRPGEGRVGPK